MDATPADAPAVTRSRARNTAIGLLARREHAQSEIQRKLRDRGYDAEITHEVVDELTQQRLLSDERFAAVFIRSRAERGQGPVRLRAELRQLRLPNELIEQRLREAEVEWSDLACAIRLRKFGKAQPKSLSERAKQVRFLQYRGFTAEHIRAAMDSFDVDDLLEADADDPAADDPQNLDPDL
ncbi:MAG: regulatory protein RecX [Steroidobacteraceae bacterium]